MQEDQRDSRSTLLRLLGIEQWLPRDRVLGASAEALTSSAARLEPTRASVSMAASLPAPVRRRVDTGAPPVAELSVPPSPRRVTQETGSSQWQIRLDMHVCAGVLAVLEQSVELPQRFVRDICTAIGNRYEALQPLEDFSWPPAGNIDLAQRELCRSALLAVLNRRWQEQQLSAVLLFGPTLLALCGSGDAALMVEERAGMRLLFIADPASLLVDAQRKRELWSLLQQGQTLQRGPMARG